MLRVRAGNFDGTGPEELVIQTTSGTLATVSNVCGSVSVVPISTMGWGTLNGLDTVRRADGRTDIVVLATDAGLVHIRGGADPDGGPARGVIATFPLNEPELSYVEAFGFGGGPGDDVLVATYRTNPPQGTASSWVDQPNVMLNPGASLNFPARANSIAGLSGSPSYAFIASDSVSGIQIISSTSGTLTLNSHSSGNNFSHLHSLQAASLLVGFGGGVLYGSKVVSGNLPGWAPIQQADGGVLPSLGFINALEVGTFSGRLSDPPTAILVAIGNNVRVFPLSSVPPTNSVYTHEPYTLVAGAPVNDLALADVTGDGNPDLIIAVDATAGIVVSPGR